MQRFCALLLLVLAASSAAAQDRREAVPFKPRYRGVQLVEWVATPIAGAMALAAYFAPVRDGRGPWHDDVDDGVRSALRLSTPSLRAAASAMGDGLLIAEATWELVDALAITGLAQRSPETAATLLFIDLEAHGIIAAIQQVTVAITARERPFGVTCGTPDGATAAACADDFSRYRSFFSGHVAHAFVGAALTCMHHANLRILGGNAEMMPCLATLGVATLDSALRLMNDAHYLSDVLVGAAVGSLVGVLVPWLLHYQSAEPATGGLRVALMPFGLGASLVGFF